MTHEAMFGPAKWVAPSNPCDQPQLRMRFYAADEGAARITICGLGFFQLVLNGTNVSDDLLVPAWTSYEHVIHQDGKRVAPDFSLHRIYALQYSLDLQAGDNELLIRLGGGWYRKFRYDQVKCCFRIEHPDGHEIYSGDAMEWSPSHILESEMLKGELHDYRTEAHWQAVAVVDAPRSDFDIQRCPADKVIRKIQPKYLGDGLYDCGENITGWPVLRMTGKRAKVEYAENIDGKENYGANWRQTDRFRSDATNRVVHPEFMWHAFRYFKITGKAEPLHVAVVHADIPITANFESNNINLNWLFNAFVRTQLSNMHCGIPSDCPQYEGRGYTGDGQLACDAALLCMDGRAFYTKWMRDIADGQDRKTGHINYTAPFFPSGGGPGGWGCAIAHVPWVYYQYYGDAAPLQDYYPHMRHYLDYLELHSEDNLVVSEEPGNWCLGDWCTPGKIEIPEPFVNNYFYIKTLREMQAIAKRIGKEVDILEYQNTEWLKIDAIKRHYYDAETGDFCKNIQGANAFAVDLGLGDNRTLANMVKHYSETRQYDTGIFGTDIVTRVLFDNGYAQLAYDLLAGEGEVSFASIRKLGGTTLWEYWDGERSHSHPMFGAVVRYLFRDLLGITQRPGTVGFKDLIIAPKQIEGLSCKGYITNANGRIKVEVAGGKVTVKAPKNTKVEMID